MLSLDLSRFRLANRGKHRCIAIAADTEDALKHGAELLAREVQDLKPSLIFPLDVPQPSVSTSHPAAVARAYSEDMLGAVGLCMHVIVLNTDNAVR